MFFLNLNKCIFLLLKFLQCNCEYSIENINFVTTSQLIEYDINITNNYTYCEQNYCHFLPFTKQKNNKLRLLCIRRCLKINNYYEEVAQIICSKYYFDSFFGLIFLNGL